ncbi:MAG: hypothetical protein MJ184_01500 [Treponema sp.]|nr:hypothetical protein [Treponema sp.]MCQ2600021.1 hypothetical protein [Treponema sp.]
MEGNLILRNGTQYERAGSRIIMFSGIKGIVREFTNLSASFSGLYVEWR